MRSEFKSSSQRAAFALCLASSLVGCTYDFSMFRRGADGATDARTDATVDAPADVRTDVPMDVATDARPDAPMDAAIDVAPDAPADVPMDAPLDVRPDAPPADVRPDTPPTDTRPDAPPTFDGGCGNVRINEVQTASTDSAADEFVELYNAGTCAVMLEGWSLRYRSADGSADLAVWTGSAGEMIAPRGFFTVASSRLMAMATPPTSMLTGGGTSGRLAGDTTGAGGIGLYPVPSGGAIVDRMGYGRGASNLYVVGMPAPAPPKSQSVGRAPDGNDTGNNATDFSVRTTPSPGRTNGT